MAVDADGNWDGVCACGKKEADGIACYLGATHQPKQKSMLMPWGKQSIPAIVAEPSFPWAPTLWK